MMHCFEYLYTGSKAVIFIFHGTPGLERQRAQLHADVADVAMGSRCTPHVQATTQPVCDLMTVLIISTHVALSFLIFHGPPQVLFINHPSIQSKIKIRMQMEQKLFRDSYCICMDSAEHSTSKTLYIPSLQLKHLQQPRHSHSTTATNLSSAVTEVTMFGGFAMGSELADTTVLQFSKWPVMREGMRKGMGKGRLEAVSTDRRSIQK